MGKPDFTTGPVAPAAASTPGTPPSTSPYANPAKSGDPAPWNAAPPGMATTQLDTPHELATSAGIARQIATDLNQANGDSGPLTLSLSDHVSTASAGTRGFAFSSALTSCTERWLKQCTALHDRIDGIATNLDTTQRTYTANEARNAQLFGTAVH
ncbi:hypothetical protein [Kitasatospora sp. NPDC085464]|uniref:hypothetical protein n=1 Tax=Kitasatospora sp. NPDC085464 TaxID=3364063 RepID=UPI0037C8A14B